MFSASIKTDLPAGTDVITQNAVADAFYVVRTGRLDVFIDGQRINALHDGDWFGEIGLLEGLPRGIRLQDVATGTGPFTFYTLSGTATSRPIAGPWKSPATRPNEVLSGWPTA